MGKKSKRKKQPTGNELKCLTINTDASFDYQYLTSGYAFYIVCDRFKIKTSGTFKNIRPQTAQEAEIMCIGNAIATLLAIKDLPSVDWLILNNDCIHGHNVIKSKSGVLGKKVWELWEKLAIRLNAKRKQFRHVKAHSGVQDARSYVNEWCDAEAKKWMRKERQEKIKLQNNEKID